MTAKSEPPKSELFFLDGTRGRLFALLVQPYAEAGETPGGVLHVAPFAEELNKSRRTVVLQARELARLGRSVLLVDPYGCGDSEGEFRDADWDVWLDDLSIALEWLADRTGAAVDLWAIRLGAPLALELAARGGPALGAFWLWQPVVSGTAALREFLRVYVAGQMLAESGKSATVSELWTRIRQGELIEIGGYELNPALATRIAETELGTQSPGRHTVHWMEVGHEDGAALPAPSRAVVEQWIAAGSSVDSRVVRGPRFWQATELVECRPLIAATTQALAPEPK